MKKMIAILGSPRKNGNAAQMLDIAVKKAEMQNYDVKFINLYEKNIAFCAGCMKCKENGRCVINDDIQDIRQQLIDCDLVVISSPTYFANVSAPVKNMFDRLVGAVMDDNKSSIPKPKLSPKQNYILLTTCNTPVPFNKLGGQSTGCLKAMKEFFHISGMKCKGKVVFAGTRNKNQLPDKIKLKIESLIQ